MKENCNLRVIWTLVIITAMTQSSLSLFSNASAGEIPGREIEIGPDIEIEGIDVWPGYPVVGRHTCKINVTLNNKGCLPADGFYVNCSLEITYLNATGGIATVKESLPQKSCALDANGMRILSFVWDPPEQFARYLPYYDVTKIKVVADPENNVDELDETNNEKTKIGAWRIYAETGYDANHPLETYAHNSEPINCGLNYTTGDSYYSVGGDPLSVDPVYGPVHFNDAIPEGAAIKIKLARLYLYWTWGYVESDDPLCPGTPKKSPSPLDVGVTFNTHTFDSVPADGNYTDLPTATEFDVAWGTYAYDVTDYFKRNNTVNAIRREPTVGGNVTKIYVPSIAGMGLLVIYERDDLPLTTYWINEGADVLWRSQATGLTPEDCTTEALFSGPADLDRVNATLWTIVPFGDTGNNRLIFNSRNWDGVWTGTITWPPGEDIRYVTNYLQPADNKAGLQEIDDCMMPSNAFLILTYPPDLKPSVKTHLRATVGKPYDIEVDIHNLGRSKAENFSVLVYIDEEEVFNESIPEIKGAGQDGSSIPLRFTKTAPLVERIIKHNVSVVVDPEDNVRELINDFYENGEENNNWTGEVTVVVKPSGWYPDPGGGGGAGGGWGTATGPDDGAGEEVDGTATTGNNGKDTGGKTSGKAYSGYWVQGRTPTSEEGAGGGGKGQFSLVMFLLQLAMLAAAVSLVFVGYLVERRRQSDYRTVKK